MRTAAEIIAWLNARYPDRDWDQQCARLVWNAVYFVSDVTEAEMTSYDPAKDGYRASTIISRDPLAAPPGAIHWWQHPAVEGHVGVELGGGRVLMTGTPGALGVGGVTYGEGYGITTVAAYSRARGNPYLGWSRRYGANPSIVGLIGAKPTTPQPQQKEDTDMFGFRPTVHLRTDGTPEWTLAHPLIGIDLEPGQSQPAGDATVFRGRAVTRKPKLGAAWSRMYARGMGGETSATKRDEGYTDIQDAGEFISLEVGRVLAALGIGPELGVILGGPVK